MTSASPTIVTLATDSAWVVVITVSFVTFLTVLILRRLMGKPSGGRSGIVLIVPLLVPLLAALVYQGTPLPEIGILRPAGPALLHRSSDFVSLLLVPNAKGGVVTPYALSATAGMLVLWIGAALSIFMLFRRLLGHIALRRFIARCTAIPSTSQEEPMPTVRRLSSGAGLKRVPTIYVKEGRGAVACAFGSRNPGIVVSEELLEQLDESELEAVLAHEIAHLRARDVRLMVVAGILRDIAAWNPIAHIAFRMLRSDREIQADRQAALLTGSPLAVASGLVKMCRLAGRGRSSRRVAVAFIRSSGGLRRRVNHLLSLADGTLVVTPERRAPFAAAAMLAMVLGLMVGARVTEGQAPALAFVWGTPDVERMYVWSPNDDAWDAKSAARKGTADRKGGRIQIKSVGAVGAGYPLARLNNVSLRQEDLPKWVHALAAISSRGRGTQMTGFEAVGWEAVPVFDAQSGVSFGLYRLEQLKPALRF